VVVSYVISVTGDVIEPMIEDSSGSADFEAAAMRAAERWKYTPAMSNGQPVEQAMVKTRMVFQLDNGEKAASASFVRKYREVVRVVSAGDFQAAEPLIAELELSERKNLYEAAWFSLLKYAYLDGTKSTDTDARIESLQRAIGYEEVYLTPDQFVSAASRLVAEHARAGDLSAAIRMFERLRDEREARRSDNYETVIASLTPAYERLQEIVRGEEVLVMNAEVGGFEYWVHDLLRRSFSVSDVNGRVDTVDVRCERGTRRYKQIPAEATWTIPPSWGACGVYIRGEPGTTFTFHEYPASDATVAPVDVAAPAVPE
jgi:TonB family protein